MDFTTRLEIQIFYGCRTGGVSPFQGHHPSVTRLDIMDVNTGVAILPDPFVNLKIAGLFKAATFHISFLIPKIPCVSGRPASSNPHTNMRGLHGPCNTLKAAQTVIIVVSELMCITFISY